MPANSFTPAFDNHAFNGQRCFVIGCGRQPTTHPGTPHHVPRPGGGGYNISLLNAYTMDIENSMDPDRVGSFWVEDHVEDLPSDSFDLIYFENLPANLFETGGWANIAARNAFRLLSSGGWVIIRTGADRSINGPIYPALRGAHFVNVAPRADQYNFIFDIVGQKP